MVCWLKRMCYVFLRYEPDVDLSTGQGVKGGEGPEDGDREGDEQVATGEVPGNSGTTGHPVLPANFRPTAGIRLC